MKETNLLEHCQGIYERQGDKALCTIVKYAGEIEWNIMIYLDTREADADDLSDALAHLRISLALCMVVFHIGRYDLDRYLNGIVGGDKAIPIQQRYAAVYPEEQRQSDEPLKLFRRRCLMLTFMLSLYAHTGDMSRNTLLKVLGELRLCAMETVCRFQLDQEEIDERVEYLLGADE